MVFQLPSKSQRYNKITQKANERLSQPLKRNHLKKSPKHHRSPHTKRNSKIFFKKHLKTKNLKTNQIPKKKKTTENQPLNTKSKNLKTKAKTKNQKPKQNQQKHHQNQKKWKTTENQPLNTKTKNLNTKNQSKTTKTKRQNRTAVLSVQTKSP